MDLLMEKSSCWTTVCNKETEIMGNGWNTHVHRGTLCYVTGATTPIGPGPPHLRGFWITRNDAPQLVGLLWTSDQLVAETSTWQHTTFTTNKRPFPRWDSNPQSQQATGPRPTPLTARPLRPVALYGLKYLCYPNLPFANPGGRAA